MLPFSKKKNIDLSLNAELSTNKLTPGILKIFGDHVSPGSNYKAVRVSTISTAQEVVREALEKFNLERCNPQDFVLCDVIGQFTSPGTSPLNESNEKHKKGKKSSKRNDKLDRYDDPDGEKPVWETEYVRAINEVEKPLVLQSLWKPTNGKSRRFELRNRIELANSFFFLNNTDSGESRSPSGTSLVNGSINSNTSHNSDSTDGRSGLAKTLSSSDVSSHHMSLRNPNRPAEIGSNVAPTYDPYLLMLKGCNNKDKLVHRLQDPTITVGAYLEHDKKLCDVLLYSSDVLLPHCWIYKKVEVDDKSNSSNTDELKYQVIIEPANGADITVDGEFISRSTTLRPGELISFGHHYLFMFKDPASVKDANISLPWLTHIKNAKLPAIDSLDPAVVQKEPEYATIMKRKETKDKCIQVELITDPVSSSSQQNGDAGDDTDTSVSSDVDDDKKRRRDVEPRKKVTKSKLQLSYNVKDEDDLLHNIIDIADGKVGPFKLLPAYFFVMAIEHSASQFTDVQTRKLLLKISSGLQGIAWEKTKEIGKTGSVKNDETMSLHNRLLPELRPVIFWLTNALQMLHYLQCNLKYYLLPREEVKSIQNAVLTADEELLSVLEEVIMFTFQQIVYHLTKVLYGALPAVLEVNPFQGDGDDDDDDDDDNAKPAHPAISQITKIFSDILSATNEHQVHPQIISQIFAYLFFFCNALLFNSLLEKGPTTKIFRWAKGVQIRGNIDVIEEWAQVNGLGKEFEEYMAKFISAVGLLSTPKVQLMQFEWSQLRNDYAQLNPAQLQLILGEYQLNGKQKPRGWYPVSEDVESALRTTDVLESFATHPPLMLPSSNFVLDLNESPPNSDEFFKHLNDLNARFDKDVEIVTEDVILPKIRKDHTTKIPVLEIKPIPPPPTEDTPKNENSSKYEEMSSVGSSLEILNHSSDGNVIDSKEDIIAPTEITNTHTQPPVETKADVHTLPGTKPEAVIYPLEIDIKDSNKNLDPNSSKNPPRVSIDLDPNFADDLKDIRERQNGVSLTTDNSDVDDDSVDITTSSQNGHNDVNLNGYAVIGGDDDDIYYVELKRENNVLGLGLIDGQFTPLKNNGIYIRTIVPNTPAATENRLRIGDRILSVNGENVLEKDYSYAMSLIKTSGDRISLSISISSEETVNNILAVA